MGDEKPNPLADAVKGLGLLLRAAKNAVDKLPKKNLEEVLITSAREVGRAIENVASTVEREVFGARGGQKPGNGEKGGTAPADKQDEEPGDERNPKP